MRILLYGIKTMIIIHFGEDVILLEILYDNLFYGNLIL